jgi:hypothetical protein
MKVEAFTDEEFFANSGDWEELLRLTDKKILSLAGNLDRQLYYDKSVTLLGYGSMGAKKNKRWPVIAIVPQKNNIAIYISAFNGDKHLLDRYENKLYYCTFGRGCIKFTKKEFLNQTKLTQIIKDTIDYYNKNTK